MKIANKKATRDDASSDLICFLEGRKFGTILADPPWQFQNRTGKVAPEHKRLQRYGTMNLDDIKALPVSSAAADTSHLYLWVPNALLPEGLAVMAAWGFQYKSNLVWHKIKDSELDTINQSILQPGLNADNQANIEQYINTVQC